MSSDWIFERYSELERDRRKKNDELMEQYDKEIYYPQLQALRRSCFQEGHRGNNFYNTGAGWSWYYCLKCGGRYNIVGPVGQRIRDSGDE